MKPDFYKVSDQYGRTVVFQCPNAEHAVASVALMQLLKANGIIEKWEHISIDEV